MGIIDKAIERQKKEENKTPVEQEQAFEFAPESSVKHKSESVIGETPTCTLDFKELDNNGYLTPQAVRGNLAEEYRLLKRPVLLNAFGKNKTRNKSVAEHCNIITITSALPGEGKSFTAFNLAMSIAAELDTTVLLVDTDVVKPGLTQMLGLSGHSGLIDVLLDAHLDLADVIIDTNMPTLRLLPAGRTHVNSAELLGSKQMSNLVAELSKRYPDRIILFDAPPLLATSEAAILADLAGQVLLVVETGRTPQTAVKDALAKIAEDKVIGLVLNKSRRSFSGDYYEGHYDAYGKS